MMTTTHCPHCANETIILGDADANLEGLLECGCGATFTEKAAHDGFAEAYYHPRLRINLFRIPGQYVSIPGGTLLRAS
jgi:hypothetical protein